MEIVVAVELVHYLDPVEPIIAMHGSLTFLKNPSLQDTAQYLKNLILQDTGLNLVREEPFTAGYRTQQGCTWLTRNS
jgi:hypothetical protein